MPVEKLKKFLDENHIKYVTITHSPAYSSSMTAQAAHVPGKELAKTVMVKIDGKMAMAVLPSTKTVNFDTLQTAIGSSDVDLADEAEFKGLFPNCETGAMPPFGNLYDMDVYVEPALTEDEEIAFNAGSHSELIRMAYADFARLVNPKVLAFTL